MIKRSQPRSIGFSIQFCSLQTELYYQIDFGIVIFLKWNSDFIMFKKSLHQRIAEVREIVIHLNSLNWELECFYTDIMA